MKISDINPVAKHSGKFNKAQTFKDRKNDYNRKIKHKGRIDTDDTSRN